MSFIVPISDEEAISLGMPESMVSLRHSFTDCVSDHVKFLIHVSVCPEVVATFGAQEVGVQFIGFGKAESLVTGRACDLCTG